MAASGGHPTPLSAGREIGINIQMKPAYCKPGKGLNTEGWYCRGVVIQLDLSL